MATQRERAVEVGNPVYTQDLQFLGTVQQVWPDARTVPDDVTENASITPDAPGGPLTRPGLCLVRAGDQDLYVPFGAIQRVEADRIVLGVPARDIPGQGWSQRPWRLAG